jgi:hypothetical protein
VYTGWFGGVSVDPAKFFGLTRLLEHNVVVFQDGYQALYQRGISGEIDSFDALLAWQREFRSRLPHVRRLFCLGNSSGGYAALLAGYLLRADRVWAFAPPTRFWDLVTSAPGLAPERRDLAIQLGADNGVTLYDIFFNETHARDRDAAARIAGCPGVRLWPQPGSGHNVVKTMIEHGTLRAAVAIEPA